MSNAKQRHSSTVYAPKITHGAFMLYSARSSLKESGLYSCVEIHICLVHGGKYYVK